MSARSFLSALAASALTIIAASAQVPPDARVKFADPRTEDRSGAPAIAKRLEATSPYQYLIGLQAWESKDAPCKVRASFAHVNQLNEFEQEWTDPGCKSPGDLREASVASGGRDFIRSLSVCLHDNRSGLAGEKLRIKGVRGRYVTLDRTPLLTRSDRLIDGHVNLPGFNGDIAGFERPNCMANWNEWQPASTCGADRVATGVVIEHKDGAWVSLRLICSTIVPNR